MKSIFTPVLFFLSLAALAQTTYNGNGASGFGGPIGGSTLVVSDNGTLISFQLTTGAAFNGNALVLYIDSKTGGPSNTSTFTDVADGGRSAISGLSGNGRTLVNFPAGFNPDYAITVEPNIFSGVFDLSTPANFGFVTSANLTSNANTTFTFSVNKTDLGIAAGSSPAFKFVGTLISTSAYRSNETIGASATSPGTPGDTPNGGFTGTQTFSGFNAYGNVTLPVTLSRFTAKLSGNQVQLGWSTVREEQLSHFTIENSANGSRWTAVATVPAKKTTSADYTQTVAATGAALYRLRMEENNGAVRYSAVVNVKPGAHTAVNLLTNPAQGVVRIGLQATAGLCTASLYSLQGGQVARLQHHHTGGASTLELPVAGVAKGSYVLKVVVAGETKSFPVLLQ